VAAAAATVENLELNVKAADAAVAAAAARVIEVHILLEDAAAVSNLTNLQVEVEITP
jgi:hypothetical protein